MTLLTIKPGRGIRYLGKFEEPEGDFIRVHNDKYIAHMGKDTLCGFTSCIMIIMDNDIILLDTGNCDVKIDICENQIYLYSKNRFGIMLETGRESIKKTALNLAQSGDFTSVYFSFDDIFKSVEIPSDVFIKTMSVLKDDDCP